MTRPQPIDNQLAKAQIINVTTGQIVSVMFNPDELRLEQGNTFAEVGVPGLDTSPVQYVRGRARALTMQLFFDSYEIREDVRAYTSSVVSLLDTDPKTHAPPVLVFTMGTFRFQCVLVDAAQRFTMFLPVGQRNAGAQLLVDPAPGVCAHRRGCPARGVLRLADRVRRRDAGGGAIRSAATGERVHLTIRGDTLSGIAAAELGDAARWRDIANANDIDDVFNIAPGTPLIIPPKSGAT